MRGKIITGLFIAIILIVTGGIIIKFMKKTPEKVESIENTESIESTETIEDTGRTDEEYISILLDNKEDFDYVAEMMKQWPERSIIDFYKEGISSDSQEIADEIENNVEFYEHLKKIYNLEEVWYVVKWDDETEFTFSKPPKDYHGGFHYWENIEECNSRWAKIIDGHWTLEILPNV